MSVAQIGHNNPPTELEILQVRLGSYIKESDRLKTFLAKEIPIELADCQEAGKLTDHIKALKVFRGEIGKIFKREKEPFFDCCKAADTWKNSYWADIDILIANASKPVLAWNKKKEEIERQRQLEIARVAREAAEKLEAEAAAHDKEGISDTAEELMDAAIQEEQKADMIYENAHNGITSRSRGKFSSATSRKPWTGALDSRAALDMNALRNYFTEAELSKAIKAAVRDGVRDLRGARIYQDEKLTVR